MKNLLFILFLTFPLFIQAQELDKKGYKFIEEVYYSYMEGDTKKLTDLYFPLQQHNELLEIQGIAEISQDVHDKKVARMINRCIENRNGAGEFDFRKVELASIEINDSNDEEALLYFDIEAIGKDSEKTYTVIIKQCIQFFNGKYYLTEDLDLTIQ